MDSFGVSAGYARLAKDIGFDAMFFGRVDVTEKQEDLKNKTRMKVWRPS